MQKTDIPAIGLTFNAKYNSFRQLVKEANRKVGCYALCYSKKLKGYASYYYDGRYWRFLGPPKEYITLADEGLILVIDKVRVVGKGWVLIIDEAPKGLTLERKVKSEHGKYYNVTGIGGWEGMKRKELILSPNTCVENDIIVGDILVLLNEL